MCGPDGWANVHQQPGIDAEPVQVLGLGQILLSSREDVDTGQVPMYKGASPLYNTSVTSFAQRI